MIWLQLQNALKPGDQPVQDTGQLVRGGWDAVSNIEGSRGEVLSTQPSGHFPTPQREAVASEINKPAGGTGDTYRETDPENPSMVQSNWWNQIGWVGTPYEQRFAEVPMRDEANRVAESMGVSGQEQPRDLLADILSGVKYVGELGTIVNNTLYNWGASDRPPIQGTPRVGYPAGTDDTHYNQRQNKGPDVIAIGKQIGGAFINQVKGLFNLAYKGPTGPQPVFSIQHEIEPGVKIGAVGIAAIIILAIFLMRRK